MLAITKPLPRVQAYSARMALILLLLNVADVVTTRIVLDRGGIEANPLMRSMFEGGQWALPLLIKLSVCFFIFCLTLMKESRITLAAVAVFTSGYLFVVVLNLRNVLIATGIW